MEDYELDFELEDEFDEEADDFEDEEELEDDDCEYDIPDEVLEFLAYLEEAINRLIVSCENIIKKRAKRDDICAELDLTCERYRGKIDAYKSILELISFK